jgi:hypothetical protein
MIARMMTSHFSDASSTSRRFHGSLSFLLRKMLSEVMPGLQQLNREAHPRDKQVRRAVKVIRFSCARAYDFVIAVWGYKNYYPNVSPIDPCRL